MYVSGDNRSGDAGALISGRGVLKDSSKQEAAKKAMSLARLSRPSALSNMSPVSLSVRVLATRPPPRSRSRTSTAARGC